MNEPTPEQMEAIERRAVDVANDLTPLLMKEPVAVMGAALGKMTASWLARYRLGDEKFADLNKRAHEGRVNILTKWMIGVVEEVPDLMKRTDDEIAARKQ